MMNYYLILLNELELIIELFKKEKQTKIKIMVLSLPNNGGIGIKTININSCYEIPIKPTDKKNINIEFIGDSIMAGIVKFDYDY